MATPPFIHLHCHSHYSLLDGASPIKGLVTRAKEQGMNALALTDHGNMYGSLEFYQVCKAQGINPIVGYEAYIAPHSRFDKAGGSLRDNAYHLTLLAKNRIGFSNLIKLASRAFLEGFYHKPRIDKEILEKFSEGIICLSGCVSGELSRTLLKGNGTEEAIIAAKETASWFERVFKDRYFIEIQDNGLEIQQLAMEYSVEVANQMGLPLVATSDAHYLRQEDAEAQDVLLCINTGRFRTDTNRMKMEGDQFFLRDAEQMFAAMPAHAEALARSQEIADGVDLEIKLGERYFPTFTPPDGKGSTEYLHELCVAGLKERYEGLDEYWTEAGDLTEVVYARLDREIGVIDKLGFPDYFLIVWDFVEYAVRENIPCTARGSGVGAIVCFALKMSHVCPLKYDLLFERFLDESRLEAPDIDIDFCRDRRLDVIQYVKDKYGEANVAQIGTFGTLAARAAIRDVGRTLGMPLFRVDAIVAMVPDQLGIKLPQALKDSAELKLTYENDPETKELLDLAMKIEGLARNVGTHAAAVVIADEPIDNYIPLQRVKGKTEIITQWAMADVENAGLLKMDFLGLKNLTILQLALKMIEESRGEKLDPYRFPMDDKATYALLCRGETKGIFQLESGGIRDLLQRMKPDNFDDIIATNALYRPGPLEGGMVDDYIEVKHGRKVPSYPHPVMKEILEETNGVMVYQEQVMRILNKLGGIQLSNSYTCIKAISKKKLAIIAQFKEQFIAGSVEKGVDKKKAQDLFEMIEKFAGYGFNKSHSTAYALIAYMTAYLKTHYSVEFMAALLSGDISGRNFKNKDSLVEHLEDCIRMKLTVLAPGVNSSQVDFSVDEGKIHFGLSAIKACGGGAAEAIVLDRKTNGEFTDIFNFCERMGASSCNRATTETLIKAGAFDCFGANRAQLHAVLDKAILAGVAAQKDRKSGQIGLFDDYDDEKVENQATADLPNIDELPERQLLTQEKEVLGYYLTSHPLAEYEQTLKMFCTNSTRDLGEIEHRSEVIVGGMMAAIKMSHTKNPKPGMPSKYAMWDLEDKAGLVRCIMWPRQFAEFGEKVKSDAIVGLRAKIDRRPGSEETSLIVDEIMTLEEMPIRFTNGIQVKINEEKHGLEKMKQLKEILRGYPGKKPLRLRLDLSDGGNVTLECPKIRLDINLELRNRIDDLLGKGNFTLIAQPNRGPIAPSYGGGRGR